MSVTFDLRLAFKLRPDQVKAPSDGNMLQSDRKLQEPIPLQA